MSDSLGAASAALSRGNAVVGGVMRSGRAVAGLLSGAVPFGGAAGGPIALGGFIFQGFEVPESVSFGGEQQIIKHRFPGGAFALDVLGADDHDVEWSGQMVGPDASARAQQLDAMRRSGAVVDLAWGDFLFPVIVRSFTADYRGRSWIGQYRISCQIAPPPEAAAGPETDALGDLAGDGEGGGILGALGDAAGEVGAVVSDAAQMAGEALGYVNGAVQAVSGVITPITSALGIQVPYLSTLQAGLGMASGAIGTLGAAGAGLSGFGAQYGASAGFNARVLEGAAEINAWGLEGSSDALDGAADSATGDDPTPASAAPKTAKAARDAAVGARAGGAINSAQKNASRGTRAPAAGPAKPADAATPGTATTPPAESGIGRVSAPGRETVFNGRAVGGSESGHLLMLRQYANDIRNSPSARTAGPERTEAIIKEAAKNSGRPDLYEYIKPK